MSASRSIESSGILGSPGPRWARTLDAITKHARLDQVIQKSDIHWGDRVIVKTRNSTYCLLALGDDTFAVSGGWFEKNASGAVGVNGCTYGGRAILHDVVAGCGLFLEFGNNVLTTRIRDVRVVPREATLA